MSQTRRGSLDGLLARSATEATSWFNLMEPWQPPGPRRFYPGRTLRTLHLAAVMQFQSGVLLLHRPTLANASSDHVRALVELFAHAAWIVNAGGLNAPMTAQARAICVELGMAKALVSELEQLESSLHIPFSPGYIADKRKLVEYFSKLHANHACACRGAGRRYNSVRPTLRALDEVDSEKRLGVAKLFYGLWLTFSRGVHFPRLEHIAADAPGGAALQPATVNERAVMLYNLVVVQGQIARFAATPFPARQKYIAVSAYFLLQDIEACTDEHEPTRRTR
jgi:hypothetical protein